MQNQKCLLDGLKRIFEHINRVSSRLNLFTVVVKVPIVDLWKTDRDNLLKLPVNKCGFAVIDTNKYGLSPTLAGRTVQAKIIFDHVEFYRDLQPMGPVPQRLRLLGRVVRLDTVCQYASVETRGSGAHLFLQAAAPAMIGTSGPDEGKRTKRSLAAPG